ncbi:NADPH:quinone reductase [Lentibacillus persicus]|uniref:NADPH:quinone reductase n=1 Tax=Lentibacillus persicus TaxID=640948 RepID=A0A1I1SBJ9_9BACI|nr:NAD(P)-dependent alcohol dehydrogenase [Lentibacillus persicus]SFD43861.1 NADPH:quinone reductase [Lentibacillus persicus]
MKAVVCTKYGSPDVLEIKEVAKPAPKENEILIKVYATTVTSGDVRIRRFISPLLVWLPMRLSLGIRRPKKPILGMELSGEVEEIGEHVKHFKKGDQVVAMTGNNFGAYAEYVCLPEDGGITIKPANVPYEDAAAFSFGATSALYFLRQGNIQKGQKVLIYGASGAVGTAAVQLAKYFGTEVTAVCSAANSELVKSLGADYVIDYMKEDFTKTNVRYDLIFDAVGKTSKYICMNELTPDGLYVSVAGQRMAKVHPEDMTFLKDLVELEKIKPVIDRRYPLGRIQEAHSYVEKGHKKGNVVMLVHDEKVKS